MTRHKTTLQAVIIATNSVYAAQEHDPNRMLWLQIINRANYDLQALAQNRRIKWRPDEHANYLKLDLFDFYFNEKLEPNNLAYISDILGMSSDFATSIRAIAARSGVFNDIKILQGNNTNATCYADFHKLCKIEA